MLINIISFVLMRNMLVIVKVFRNLMQFEYVLHLLKEKCSLSDTCFKMATMHTCANAHCKKKLFKSA